MAGALQNIASKLALGLQALNPGSSGEGVLARRRLMLRLLRLVRTEVAFRRNGFDWTGLTHCSITREIYLNDHYQDASIEHVAGWLKAHGHFDRSVIVNVGANLGDVALPLTRTGKRVIAVEPNPQTFARLERNVRRNGLEDRITCCRCAVSEAAGTAELVMARDPGNSELNSDQGRVGFDGMDQRQDLVQVQTTRLDSLVGSVGFRPEDVALVWSDTQGFESHVIASGTALWQGGTPLWVELWPRGLACHGGVTHFLDLCRQHFRTMVPAADFAGPGAASARPRPVAELEPLLAGLQNADFTDVLLLP